MKLVHDATTQPAPKDPIAETLSRTPAHLDIDLSQAIRLMGGSAANGDNSDPLVLQGAVEMGFRRLIARFGFDRLPFTYGEAQGLLDYCERLDSAAGIDMIETAYLEDWQNASFKVMAEHHPHLVAALELYCKGDKAGLLALHKAQDTLTHLGKNFREYPDEQ